MTIGFQSMKDSREESWLELEGNLEELQRIIPFGGLVQ
jgi:hypothetical protein